MGCHENVKSRGLDPEKTPTDTTLSERRMGTCLSRACPSPGTRGGLEYPGCMDRSQEGELSPGWEGGPNEQTRVERGKVDGRDTARLAKR